MGTVKILNQEEINSLRYQALVEYTTSIGAQFGYVYNFEKKQDLIVKAIDFSQKAASVSMEAEVPATSDIEVATAPSEPVAKGSKKKPEPKEDKSSKQYFAEIEEAIDLSMISNKVSASDAIDLWNISEEGKDNQLYINDDLTTKTDMSLEDMDGNTSIIPISDVVRLVKSGTIHKVVSGEIENNPSVDGGKKSKVIDPDSGSKAKQAQEGSTVESKKSRSRKSEKTEKPPISVNTTEAQQKILDSDIYSKSDKIRKLYQSKMSVASISHILGIHYSFAYCVVDKFRKDHGDCNKKFVD